MVSDKAESRFQGILRYAIRAGLLAACLVSIAATPGAAKADKPDFATWQRLPVFYDGRMMPLNTFSRVVVESTCKRANPRLSLDGVSDAVRELPEFSETEKMFPDGPRTFSASEVLFSWMVEPERWEYVPFLIAEHETLRAEIFDLSVLSAKGNHLKYVSPYDVAKSAGFQEAIRNLDAKQRSTPSKKLKLTSTEVAVEKLYQAYMTYRSVTFDPFRDEPRMFTSRVNTAFMAWNETGKAWNEAKPEVATIAPVVYADDIDSQLEAVRSSLASLATVSEQVETPDPLRLETILTTLARQTTELAGAAERGRDEIFARPQPEGMSETRWRQLRNGPHVVAAKAADLVTAVQQAQLALYDSRKAVRLLPSLNPAALEENRDTEDDVQPWLSLQTVLFAGDDVYRTFLRPDLPEASVTPIDPTGLTRLEYLQRLSAEGNPTRPERAAFAEATAAYLDRGAGDRGPRFAAAMERFAAEIRQLGESIEPVREQMDLDHPDEKLIAVTAYPDPGATDAEVFYYHLDPFKWTWVFSFLSLCCLAAAFGAMRGPMYWTGITVLIIAQSLSICGFALRCYITGWAPVTNMFETVVFVSLVTAVLGLWFAMAPLFGPGLRRAWRMTAIPGTPEAGSLSEDDLEFMSESSWTRTRAVVLLPRLALAYGVFHLLTQVVYGSGSGYTIIRLAPRGSSINDQVVWIVGLSMMAIAIWLVPRLILTAVLGLMALPWSFAKSGLAEPLRKAMDRKPFAVVGAGTAFAVGLIAYFAPIWDKDINPLMPVLRDNFWLTLHVLTITASYGAGFLAWGLGVIAMGYYSLGRYRDPLAPTKAHIEQGHRPAHGYRAPAESFHRRVPEECVSLSGFIYKAIQVAVVLLAAGTILGGLWADVSWGRFWGWDSKEVWALISLLIYVGILHFRFTGVLRDFALAAGAVLGITSIVMAWWGVNFFLGSGLHSYGSGAGGGWYVLGFIMFNCAVIVAGAVRYLSETGGAATPVQPPTPPSSQVSTKAVPKPQS